MRKSTAMITAAALLSALAACGGMEAKDEPVSASAAADTADTAAVSAHDILTTAPEPVDQNIDIDMVFVKGGTFMMGCTEEQGFFAEKSGTPYKCTGDEGHDEHYCDCDDDEKPAHRVTLGDFYMGKYEVTQGLWMSLMGSNPFDVWGRGSPDNGTGDNYPVYYVSYNDVQEFIRKLNAKTGKTYRLPTEAEWEYAARGGNKSKGNKYSGAKYFPRYLVYSGGELRSYSAAWFGENSGGTTQPVGTQQPNELGLYDMSGNVYEWVSDRYGNYSPDAQINPAGPEEGPYRVYRGGFYGGSYHFCRVSYRTSAYTEYRYDGLGFRLARVP